MTLRVAINGFGRIGRNFTRCWLSRGANTGIELANQMTPGKVPVPKLGPPYKAPWEYGAVAPELK